MKKNNTSQTTEYFDSANISESYSGIVLPLTCSFAKMIYEQVYRDLMKMSGVSMKKVNSQSEIFANLLGFFYGRMYYNMNNWYLMAAFIPGYERNKKNFELMITSNIKQEIVTSISPSVTLKILYPSIVTLKILLFGVSAYTFKKIVSRELKNLRSNDFSNLKYEECIELFENMNKNLLRRWYITAENDFIVMTYLGILKKLIGEEKLQKLIIFPSKATQQVQALANLSQKMQENKNIWEAVVNNNAEKFNDLIGKNKSERELLNNYLLLFGGRFANELKLESVGVDEDITKLFTVLKAYVGYKSKSHEDTSKISLPLHKKVLLQIALSQFKKFAGRREEFRLLRSNTFGMTRKLFRRMGYLLHKSGVLKNADDVFYLTLPEILDKKAGANIHLTSLVSRRKKEYEEFKKVSPPTHFSTANGKTPIFENVTTHASVISARPASAGIIRGKVRVFKEFYMPDKIDFDILITSHTDPGWTSLIALSKGLIIEHGGVLSHASIVARELRIPAVIGAQNATNSFKDGQVVEINGSTGEIKVIS